MKTGQIYKLYRKSKGICTDSRTITEGQIFFALWGDNHNGNKFASDAIERGASWAIIDDPAFESDKTILVDNTLAELQALAVHHRKKMNAHVLAITGTNGKTTTKELVSAVLSRKFRVHSTKGNLNNHIGVPLTILSAPEGTEIMIIEMGANHVGEIRTLCLIAKPDYGIITNMSPAHIEGFGSFEGVVKTKTELYEHLRKVNGIALYNDKDQLLTEKIYRFINRAVPFSDPAGIELAFSKISSDKNLKFKISYQNKSYDVNTSLFGRFNIENIKAAMATGLFFGVDIRSIVEEVEKYTPHNNRSEIKVTGNNTIVCDAYNANPVSMKLAIESFAAMKADRKVCILGDMLELGDRSEEEHLAVHKVLTDHNLSDVMLVGPVFSKVSARFRFRTFSDVGRLKEFLKTKPLKGCHILIKGSHGMALEQLYDIL